MGTQHPPKKGTEPPPEFLARVYYGQTAGCIKMPLGMEVGLSPGDFLLDGDPAPPSQKEGGAPPQLSAMSIVAKRLDGSRWYLAWRWALSGPHCARWGPSPLPKKGAEPPPQFLVHFYCGQTAGCIKMPLGMEVGLSPGDFVLNGDPDPSPKRGRSSPQIFGPCFCVKTAGWIKMVLGVEVGLSPGDFVLNGDPAPSQKGGGSGQTAG